MFVQALAANQWVSIAILAVFFVLMIVMTIIPQRKRKKEYQDLMSNLSVGDKVMTIGRLIGKIYAIDDDSKQVTLNVGTDESETLIVIDKNAIATVIDSKNKPKTEEKPKKPLLFCGGYAKILFAMPRHCLMRKCWNRQTGTFEVRVSMTCGFKSHLPHQKEKDALPLLLIGVP